jgi:hypothetical protein
MTNFSEKGHAKNVANLGTLNTFITGFGAGYNPSKQSITLAALNNLHEEAERSLTQVNTHFANWAVAVEAQQTMFAWLNGHLTRIVNAVENCEVPPAIITAAKALNRKLQGSKPHKAESLAAPLGEATPEMAPGSFSTSRMSQDSRIENLGKLVQLLSEQPGYAPNEPDLQLSALQSLLADFKTKNEAVKTTQMMLSNARINRNKTIYHPESGLLKAAANTKKYVKSLYGAASPEFEQVSGLVFTRLRH